jgi:hypothetical protein
VVEGVVGGEAAAGLGFGRVATAASAGASEAAPAVVGAVTGIVESFLGLFGFGM